MSATELIQQVAALPHLERKHFEQLFLAMKRGGQPQDQPAHSNWPDFGERLRRIYGDKITPDSQPVIDEGRGEH